MTVGITKEYAGQIAEMARRLSKQEQVSLLVLQTAGEVRVRSTVQRNGHTHEPSDDTLFENVERDNGVHMSAKARGTTGEIRLVDKRRHVRGRSLYEKEARREALDRRVRKWLWYHNRHWLIHSRKMARRICGRSHKYKGHLSRGVR